MSIKNEDVSDMPEEFYKSQFLSHQLKAISMQPDYRKTVDCGELLGISRIFVEWICQTYHLLASGASQSAWNGLTANLVLSLNS